MSEISQVWNPLRNNLGVYGHFTRIESPTISGIPDVAYTLFSCSGWIENKLFEHHDKCPSHLTLEQVLWGEAEIKAGGRWFLLGICNGIWLLYDIVGARTLLKGERPLPLIQYQGSFPTRRILEILAPPFERSR